MGPIRHDFDDGTRCRSTTRAGSVASSLDPDESALGPDAMTRDAARRCAALLQSDAPVKARLMDQAKLAGVGNLTADEVLWRAGVAPDATGALTRRRRSEAPAPHLRQVLRDLDTRGGSHTGDVIEHRTAGGALSQGRRRDAAGDRRRTHDVVVPAASASRRARASANWSAPVPMIQSWPNRATGGSVVDKYAKKSRARLQRSTHNRHARIRRRRRSVSSRAGPAMSPRHRRRDVTRSTTTSSNAMANDTV